ncbi:toll/interleukin-1 receptor domain-containing protein [Pacificimonas sp. WHA3]|uniref:Toll/interleukin-1 receptor domain-containing protein n=1 Tax=Pacificimonas pallii TaxID=2827236 RepID=A0ABS6SBS2_9SPHN|nr:toll/interleukin-1 receptor domain-containing protein [Pacificimonas pallii]MBV7255543.1 toll/interleukin-1 receptor domain-containing protein [Pacificimonas pallii]
MAQKVFISYAHADGSFLEKLHKHLAQLVREGTISEWQDKEISAGDKFDDEISDNLEKADIFLACASPDWIASEYVYEKELKVALNLESEGNIIIIPVIFRPCDWQSTSLRKFKAIPKDGKPVTEFINEDVAFLDIVAEIRKLVNSNTTPIETKSAVSSDQTSSSGQPSRYRVRREFDEIHKRDFVENAYLEIYRFFESSAAEIATVDDIEVRLSPVEGNSFSCTIVNRGIRRGFETINVRKGGMFGAIDLIFGENPSLGSSNGGFVVEADEYQLGLKSIMFNMTGDAQVVNSREAAKMMWDELLSKVGIDYA